VIDSTTEEVIPLTEAANRLPRRRRGRKAHVSTLYRWAQAGCRGVRLETIQIGGTCCTSAEALQRFFETLTVARSADAAHQPGAPLTRRTSARRLRDSERAGRELEAMGA
jgi:hypothetical protein